MNAADKIKENMERVIIGKGEVIELVLTALVAGGHVLRKLYRRYVKHYWKKRERKIKYMDPEEQIAWIRQETSLTEGHAKEIRKLYEEAGIVRESPRKKRQSGCRSC